MTINAQDISMRVVGGVLKHPLPPDPGDFWSAGFGFENGAVGAECLPLWDTGNNNEISADQAYKGTKSCKMSVSLGGENWGGGYDLAGQGRQLFQDDEVWFRIATYFPAGFNMDVQPAGGSRLKFIRVKQHLSGGAFDGHFDMQFKDDASAISIGLEKSWPTFVDIANTAVVFDTWQVWEIYFYFDWRPADDALGNGRIRIWLDDALKIDKTDQPTLIRAGNQIIDFPIFSSWNTGSPATQHCYVDGGRVTNGNPGSFDASGNPFIGKDAP